MLAAVGCGDGDCFVAFVQEVEVWVWKDWGLVWWWFEVHGVGIVVGVVVVGDAVLVDVERSGECSDKICVIYRWVMD